MRRGPGEVKPGRVDVVAAEASRGPLLLGGLTAVVVAAGLSWIAKPDATQWADRTTLSSLLCVFTAPVLGGVSAIVAGSRMAGLSELASSTHAGYRHPARVVLWAAAVWVVPVALAQVVSPLVARPPWGTALGIPVLLPWLETAAILMATVCLGVMAGARWHGWLVGPAVAALSFGWLYLSTFLPGRWNLLAPADNATFFQPWTEPRPNIILAHTGLALALSLAVVGQLATQARRGLASLAVCVALVSAAALVTSQPERSRARTLVGPPACAAVRGVSFCAWPALDAEVPRVASALASAQDVVGDRWPTDDSFAQDGLPDRVRGRRMQLGLPVASETLMVDALYASLPTCAASTAGAEARSQLMGWLSARVGLDQAPDSPFHRLASSDQATQNAWIAKQLSDGGCR